MTTLNNSYRVTNRSGFTYKHDSQGGKFNNGSPTTYENWQFNINGSTDWDNGTHSVKIWRIGKTELPGTAVNKKYDPIMGNYIGEFSTPLDKGWKKYKNEHRDRIDYVEPDAVYDLLNAAAIRLKNMAYAALAQMEAE